jgi:hypothetical protein
MFVVGVNLDAYEPSMRVIIKYLNKLLYSTKLAI